MRKSGIALLIAMFFSFLSYAADFAPTLLKLSAAPIIQYDFDGSDIDIPVQVSGITAGVIFLVYTRSKAEEMPSIQNGYLGWHHVSRIDTCIYFSTMKSFDVGTNTITWDGKDQDGGTVPSGEYTYYMYAYDNIGTKQKVSEYLRIDRANVMEVDFLEVDEDGLPLANPLLLLKRQRWTIGNDPMDATLLAEANIPLAEGWSSNYGSQAFHPTDHNYFYIEVMNGDLETGAIQKYKWVPGGDCELQTDFGDEGWSEMFPAVSTMHPGVENNRDYMFAIDTGHLATNDPWASFYIFDYDGYKVKEIDLTDWWSSSDQFEAGGQMNGGPNNFSAKNDMVFLNARASCLNQMVDPMGFLESDDIVDFYLWSNGNGDYVNDINFEETAALPWVCFDHQVGPYTYVIDADNNYFSAVNPYDVGAVSFGLLGPDGTGLGHFSFAGETAGWKKGTFHVDSDTPFDGIYCDNNQAGGTHYQEGGWQQNEFTTGTFFIGHDSITGVITSGVGVEEAAPAAFSVAQNSPNPFNPTTTISFTLASAGNVSVEVFNVAGQKVDTIADGFMDTGSHSVVWDASEFSTGVYFYKVRSGDFVETKKMNLIR